MGSEHSPAAKPASKHHPQAASNDRQLPRRRMSLHGRTSNVEIAPRGPGVLDLDERKRFARTSRLCDGHPDTDDQDKDAGKQGQEGGESERACVSA